MKYLLRSLSLLVLAACLCACAGRAVQCDGELQPINAAAPTTAAHDAAPAADVP